MHIPVCVFAAEFREPINLIAAYHGTTREKARVNVHNAAAACEQKRKSFSLTSLITDYRSSTFLIDRSNRLLPRPKSKLTPVTFQTFSFYFSSTWEKDRTTFVSRIDRSSDSSWQSFFLGKQPPVQQNLLPSLIIGYCQHPVTHSYTVHISVHFCILKNIDNTLIVTVVIGDPRY